MLSPLKVQVADGNTLHCNSHLADDIWVIQGHEFKANLKVLPLSPYDMILGLDWLEQFSPMKVHWQQKWMTIPYQISFVTLFGLLPDFPTSTVV